MAIEEYGFMGERLYIYRESDLSVDIPFMTLIVTGMKMNETDLSVEITLSGHLAGKFDD